MKKDYRFWFDLIIIVIAALSLIVSITSLNKTSNLNLEMKELKTDFIETIKIVANNATIQNIDGIECIILKSGGKICSAD